VSGILPIANGGTGVNSSNPILGYSYIKFSAVATGTTIIPSDDTIPQITEGNEYMTLTYTPKSATSTLIIRALVNMSNSALTSYNAAALFQDSNSNSLVATLDFQQIATGSSVIPIQYSFISGSTSSTTFRIRAGGSQTGTTTFNGVSGGRIYGGVMSSYMELTEIGP
jgi:hypothetical protein